MSTSINKPESAVDTFLRPEARSFSWEGLTESQQNAFGELSAALATAVQAIDARPSRSSTAIDDRRLNQTIMLTADRGMGKTSLMLTLQDAIRPGSNWRFTEKSEKDSEIGTRLGQLERRVIWLDTLDMEPLSGPTNLMVAILARVEGAVSRCIGRTDREYGMLNSAVGAEKDLLELKRLCTDASLAWDGNVRERASSLDPDSFASEVMRAEQARLSINKRFDDILDSLAKNVQWREYRDPLFVLPVDDFDLNPVRCLELLRLIRALTVPRLFTLVLGDDSVAEEVFKLKMAGDFARVADLRIDAQSLYETDFFNYMSGISSHALRKLLPPAQRVKLLRLKISESLNYRPERDAVSMQDLFERWQLDLELPLAIPHEKKGEKAVQTLADFLSIQPFVPEKNPLQIRERLVYSACNVLDGPPREIADLWFTLQKRSGSGRIGLIEHARGWASHAILNDANLPIWERHEIKETLENPGMNNSFDTRALDATPIVSPGPRLALQSEHSPQVTLKCNYLQEVRMHYRDTSSRDVKDQPHRDKSSRGVKDQPQDKKKIDFMDKRTQGYVTLFHDLVSLGVNAPIVGEWILKDPVQYDLASVSWHFPLETLNIHWHGFYFRSIWEQDRFADGWNRFVTQRFNRLNWEDNFAEDIAMHWIGLCAAMLTGNKYVGPWQEPLEPSDRKYSFDKQIKSLVAFVEDMVGDSERFGIWRRKQALIGLALTLSFESGVPLKVAEPFWKSRKLLNFWKTEFLAIRASRARSTTLSWMQERLAEYRWSLVNPRFLLNQVRKQFSETTSKSANTPKEPISTITNCLRALEKQTAFEFRDQLNHALVQIREALPRQEFQSVRSSLGLVINSPDFIFQSLSHPSNTIEEGMFCPSVIERAGE